MPKRDLKAHYLWYKDTDKVVKTYDPIEWAMGFEVLDRKVVFTKLKDGREVSTVFLGLDFNFSDKGPKSLFETMVFSGKKSTAKPVVISGTKFPGFRFRKSFDEFTRRYPTPDAARKGHKEVVRLCQKQPKK